MSDVIKLLPDSVANQIAAGEVIQRPASVIKELVENAIDAQATSVEIILKDAGRTLIQVVDNGVGMSATDARLAFERHSTSKIRKADDLFSLATMGFRGEALASIAAIAQVELRTQRKEDEVGTFIEIEASKCLRQEPGYFGTGSSFMIKNIFFNVPARRKFLKNNQVELSNILREFERLALVNYGTDFTLSHNGNVMYQLRGESFKQRIVALFGRTFDTQLIPVGIDTSLIKIDGFVCRPENARKRNQQQFLFVNGRFMRHPYFHKAIMSAYEQLIPADEQPNYFLNFSVDPGSIDVNIHPTKTEIKFENDQPIWQIINAAVKEALGRFSLAPTIDFDNEDAPEIPTFSASRRDVEQPEIALDSSYNPFNQPRKSSSSVVGRASSINRSNSNDSARDWDKLYENFSRESTSSIVESSVDDLPPSSEPEQQTISDEDISMKAMQVKGRYILSQAKSGIMIIDQHRAHVCVLFNRFMAQRRTNVLHSQRLLFPEVLHLTQPQSLIVEEIAEDLRLVGFDLSSLGGNDWSVNGVPSDIDGLDVQDLLNKVIESVIEGGESLSDRLFEHVALKVAEQAAIPYGRLLSDAEMESLMGDLLQLPSPNYTPDGRLVINILSTDSLNNMFQ